MTPDEVRELARVLMDAADAADEMNGPKRLSHAPIIELNKEETS